MRDFTKFHIIGRITLNHNIVKIRDAQQLFLRDPDWHDYQITLINPERTISSFA